MRIAFIFTLCILSFSAFAQYRPPGMRDMRLYNDIADVLSVTMPSLEERGALINSTGLIESKRNIITESLKWASDNSGYLIRIKVLQSTLSGATVPMPPEFLGVGSIPSDIVALRSSQASISASPDPNLRVASDRTFYVWVTQRKGGLFGLGKEKLTYGYIVSPFSEKVTMNALRNLANADVLEGLKVAQQGEVLYGLSQNLKKNVKDKEAAVRTAEQIDSYRKNLEQLNKLDAVLKRDLRRIEQANQSLSFINNLRAVLSVASLAIQVSAAMEDIPSSQINRARTPEDLIMALEAYKRESDGRVEEGRRSIIILRDNIKGETKIIMDELYRMKVPPPIINSGFRALP